MVLLTAVFLVLAATPPPAAAVSADDSVAGLSSVTPAQLEGELSAVNPGHIHPDIAHLYVTWGYRFGIRADVAFAQMLHETNFLRYGGDVQAWQNNFAGIGATGGGNPGNSFANAEAGVIAHYAHLAWYVYPSHVNEYCNSAWDPRHFGSTHRYTVHRIRDLGGQWAVPGTGYGDAIARYASDIWRYSPRGYWMGSFNELPGTADSELDTVHYFPWYDSLAANSMAGNWILVGNMGSGTATVEIFIGGQKMHDPANPANDFFTIPEGGRTTPQFANTIGGPVKIVSTSGQPLIASQRVIYRDTFNEVTSTPASRLSSSYEFTWYDSKRANFMAGNWILVSNQGSIDANVEIWIGDRRLATYAIHPGGIITPQFHDLIGGPVRVVSTNGQPLIASQRVLFKESFNELMGVPTGELASEYYFTWYDSKRSNNMHGDWVLVANRGASAADVDIHVGGALVGRYSAATGNAIQPGGMVAPQFPELTNGPVRVVSTNSQPLMVSQRVLYRDSFEEVQGQPPAALASSQWFTWYDSMLVNFMRGNWVLVGNMGSGTATVEIYVGGVRMNDPENPANNFFTIPEGGRITPQFPGTIGGPVRVVSTSGQPVIVSQRVLFKDGLIR